MSKLAESIKKWYDNGNWTRRQVEAVLERGKITQEEFDWIVGDVETTTNNGEELV